MMEEVSDDTNGESSFEFVGGKIDDTLVKEDNKAEKPSISPEEHISSPSVVPVSTVASTFLPPSQPQLDLPTFPIKPLNEQSPITFYDPTQHMDSKTVVLPQLSPPNISPQIPPNVPPSLQQMPYAPMQPGYPSAQGTPPNFQPAVPPGYFEQQGQYSALSLPLDANPGILNQGEGESGVWGWFKGKDFLSKVAEKAKNSVDSVITTLDPGMKEIINTGGDISVIVASSNEAKVSAVREAFQHIFGKATVQGIGVQSSSIAPQPVGFSAGLKAAEERINNLRLQGCVHEKQILLAIENFLTELTPENWFDIGCLLLQDYNNGITLQVYTEAVPISSHYISQAKDQTPADYPLGWSGFAVTIGQIMGPALGVHHSEWHQALTGVSRREILFLAAKTIAGLYRSNLKR